MYGRLPDGHSSTRATHQPPATMVATPMATICLMRRPSGGGPATRYTRASAGITTNACIILARKPNPTSEPASTIQRVRPSSSARTTA